MIETYATLLDLAEILAISDFGCVGSNDLAYSILAVELATQRHLAVQSFLYTFVLRAMDQIILGAQHQGALVCLWRSSRRSQGHMPVGGHGRQEIEHEFISSGRGPRCHPAIDGWRLATGRQQDSRRSDAGRYLVSPQFTIRGHQSHYG